MSTPNDLWNEQEMADLVGLQLPDTDIENVDNPDAETTSPDQSTLLDPEDLADTSPTASSRFSLAANPFTKLGVVAAGTGLVIGVLAVFTHSVMREEIPQPVAEAEVDFADPMVAAETLDAEADERGELLTDLAMGQQQADLEALDEAPTFTPEPPKPQNPKTPKPLFISLWLSN